MYLIVQQGRAWGHAGCRKFGDEAQLGQVNTGSELSVPFWELILLQTWHFSVSPWLLVRVAGMSALTHGCFLSVESSLAIWQARLRLLSPHGAHDTWAHTIARGKQLGRGQTMLDFLLSFSGQLT